MAKKVVVHSVWWVWEIVDFLIMRPGTWFFCAGKDMWPGLRQILTEAEAGLDPKLMVHCEGVPGAIQRRGKYDPRANLPGKKRWKVWVAVEAADPAVSKAGYFVGWEVLPPDPGLPPDLGPRGETAVVRRKVKGPVRFSLGPGKVRYFGLNRRGEQILLVERGKGRLGVKGPYSKCKLL